MNPPESSAGVVVSPGIAVDTGHYHDAYRWRRERSSMATEACRWLCDHVTAWVSSRSASEPRRTAPLRILSVGCGDGSLDLPLLQRLQGMAEVDYTGVDVNTTSLAEFRGALADMPATLLNTPVEELSPTAEPFDLVIVSHMLYYVDDPAGLVLRLLHHFTRTDGQLIVIHSAHDGVPALMASVDGLEPFLTAEDIAAALTAKETAPTWHRLHTELDATDLLAGTSEGLAVLEFCIETELSTLAPDAQDQLQAALAQRCTTRDGRRFMAEEVGVLLLTNHLRTGTSRGPVVRHDPLEDYHQLAEAFAWPERLATLPHSDDGRVHLLDVGCGTGRWLRVLRSTFHELAEGEALHIQYSMLDPVATALDSAASAARDLFSIGAAWNDFVQSADLPQQHFGLIWAVHSLYGVPLADLPEALRHMLAALHPQGTAIIVLPDDDSFYVKAAEELLGHTVFTSGDDVKDVLEELGVQYQVRHVRYDERIPVDDEITLRHYVWVESIGNSFVPGGDRNDLPPLPTGDWWESHRRGDVFAFPQNVQVITIAGGQ